MNVNKLKTITWDTDLNKIITNLVGVYAGYKNEPPTSAHIMKSFEKCGYHHTYAEMNWQERIFNIVDYMERRFNYSYCHSEKYIYGMNSFSWILKDLLPEDFVYYQKESRTQRMIIEEFKYIAWRISKLIANSPTNRITVSRSYFNNAGTKKDYQAKTGRNNNNHKYTHAIRIFREMAIFDYKRVRGSLKNYWINSFTMMPNNPFYFEYLPEIVPEPEPKAEPKKPRTDLDLNKILWKAS